MNTPRYCVFAEEKLGRVLFYVRIAAVGGIGYMLGFLHGTGMIRLAITPNERLVGHLGMLLLLGLAVGNFAMVVSKMPIFDSIRRKIDLWDPNIGFALKCTYCLMGWTTIPVLLFYFLYRMDHIFFAYSAGGINLLFPLDFIFAWLVVWSIEALYYERMWAFLPTVAPKKRLHRGDTPPFLTRLLTFLKGGT